MVFNIHLISALFKPGDDFPSKPLNLLSDKTNYPVMLKEYMITNYSTLSYPLYAARCGMPWRTMSPWH